MSFNLFLVLYHASVSVIVNLRSFCGEVVVEVIFRPLYMKSFSVCFFPLLATSRLLDTVFRILVQILAVPNIR